MGNSLSLNKVNTSKILVDEIKSIVNNLSYNKREWWLNEDNCQKLEMLYQDELMKFDKNIIIDSAIIIGIPIKETYSKEIICNKITQHFRKRAELMKTIINAVDQTQIMIKKLNNGGNVCTGVDKFVGSKSNKVIDDWIICGQIDGVWIDEEKFNQILKKIKETDRYKLYYSSMIDFELNYYKFLRILRAYLYKIKEDVDNKMPDEEYYIMEKEILTLIEKMKEKCETFYLIAINLLK